MAQHDESATLLYEWAARKFAGEDLGRKILWSNVEPLTSTGASCRASPIAQIQVGREATNEREKGKASSFEVLWRRAVFELYNVANGRSHMQLLDSVEDGKLSKREFVERTIAIRVNQMFQKITIELRRISYDKGIRGLLSRLFG